MAYQKIRAIREICVYNQSMQIPKLQKPDKYVGLYIVDFDDHSGVGFTAQEVAELLESERYKHCKVYKIHKAYPDGRLEITGIAQERFQLESGMFFYSANLQTAQDDFKKLIDLAVRLTPPCRSKVQLAKYSDEKFAVSLIYPAEYEDEISGWLLDGDYNGCGLAEGGISAVQMYYEFKPRIMQTHQLFGRTELISRTGQELLANLKTAVQR